MFSFLKPLAISSGGISMRWVSTITLASVRIPSIVSSPLEYYYFIRHKDALSIEL